MRIEESLKSEAGHRIDFANDILKNNKINVGKDRMHYKLINIRRCVNKKIWKTSVKMLPYFS